MTLSEPGRRSCARTSEQRPAVGVAGSDDQLNQLILGALAQTSEFSSCAVEWSKLDEFAALLLVEASLQRLCAAVERVRNIGFFRPVLCAGKADQLDAVGRAIAAGADDYVAIPGRLPEIPFRLMALMRHQSRTLLRSAPKLSVDGELPAETAGSGAIAAAAATPSPDALLDANQRTLSFDGVAVTLTSSEMHIVRHLCFRAGAWVTASELMEQVFGYGSRADNSLIRVHISSLRKKLGDRACCLESRRTLGYRWRSKSGDR